MHYDSGRVQLSYTGTLKRKGRSSIAVSFLIHLQYSSLRPKCVVVIILLLTQIRSSSEEGCIAVEENYFGASREQFRLLLLFLNKSSILNFENPLVQGTW